MREILPARLKGYAICTAVLSLAAWAVFWLVWNGLTFFYSDLALVLPWVIALVLLIPAGAALASRRGLPVPNVQEGVLFLAVAGTVYAGAASFLWDGPFYSLYFLYEGLLVHLNPVMGALEEVGFLLPFSWYEALFLPGGFFLVHLFCALLSAGAFLLGMVFWEKWRLTRDKTVV